MQTETRIEELLRSLTTQQVGTLPLFDVIDALPAAIYTTDTDGNINLYNKAAVELWGRTPDRADEKWCGSWKLYHPDGRAMPHDACPMAEALRTGEPVRGREAIAEKPDGTLVNFIPYPTPVRDENGTLVGAINMLVDITDRKQWEDALARSEAKLRDFVETAPIGLHWVGPDGVVLWANGADMELLGYEASAYIGRHIAEFHADGDVIEDILTRLGRLETIRDYPARLKCKDGSIRHVLISSSVYTENGEFVHTRCFTRDVTSQKDAEEQLDTRIRQLQIISELGLFALENDDLDILFKQVAAQLANGLGVEYVKVLELCSNGDLFLREGIGWKEGTVGHARVGGKAGSQAGYTLSVAQPVIVTDLDEETRFRGPALLLEHGVTSGLSTIIHGRNGEPFGVLGAHTAEKRQFTGHDISFLQSVANILSGAIAKQAYRDTQEMVRGELLHRFKNNMSVILGTARMTAQTSDSIEQFMEGFEGRLSAFTRTQDILVASDWKGSGLSDLLTALLEESVGANRLRLEVEDVKIGTDVTQSMSMVVHELLTNAIKYGALSAESGMIAVTGKHDRDGDVSVYRITWQETGGPEPQPPSKPGFGSQILQWTVERKYNGDLNLEWRPEGLRVDIALPLHGLT